jgi:hypothetical protein
MPSGVAASDLATSAPVTSFTWSESAPEGAQNTAARASVTCSPQDGSEYAALTISGDLPAG